MDRVKTLDEYKYKKYKRIYATLAAGILAFFVANYVSQTLIILGAALYIVEEGWFTIFLVDVPMYCVAIWGFMFFMSKLPHKKPVREKFKASNFFSVLIISFFVMLAGAMIGNITDGILQGFFGSDTSDALTETVSTMTIWEELLFLVIIAPLGEELIFRKLLIDRSWMYGERAAIFFSAACFGIFHGNTPQIIYTTMIGLILGYLYVRSGSYVLCVIVHGALNLFFGVIYPHMYVLMESGDYFVNEIVTKVIVFSQWGFALIGFVVFLVRVLKKRFYIRPEVPFKRKGSFKGAFGNAPFIVFASVTGFLVMVSYLLTSVPEPEKFESLVTGLFRLF